MLKKIFGCTAALVMGICILAGGTGVYAAESSVNLPTTTQTVSYQAKAAVQILPGDVANNNNYSKKSTSGKSRGGSSSGFSGGGSLGIGGAVIILAIFAFIYYKKCKSKGQTPSITGFMNELENAANQSENRDTQNTNEIVADNTNHIVDVITRYDPMFSADKFLGWTREVFITIQQAWTAKDWSKIRPFEKEELFRQHEMQLQEYIDKHRTNIIERININQTYLFEYKRDNDYEYMKVYLNARMNDYIIDDMTKQVVQGDPNEPYYLRYILTFMRKKGVLTDPATSNKSTTACPHCGAPTQITSAGKCEYCGFIVTTGEHDWVLSDLSGINETTGYLGQGGVFISETDDSNDSGNNQPPLQ